MTMDEKYESIQNRNSAWPPRNESVCSYQYFPFCLLFMSNIIHKYSMEHISSTWNILSMVIIIIIIFFFFFFTFYFIYTLYTISTHTGPACVDNNSSLINITMHYNIHRIFDKRSNVSTSISILLYLITEQIHLW